MKPLVPCWLVSLRRGFLWPQKQLNSTSEKAWLLYSLIMMWRQFGCLALEFSPLQFHLFFRPLLLMPMKRTKLCFFPPPPLLSWKQAGRDQGSNVNLVTERLLNQKILCVFAYKTFMPLQFEGVWSKFTLFPRFFGKVSGYKLDRNFKVILSYSFYAFIT